MRQTIRLGVAGCGGKWGHGIRSHVIPGLEVGFALGGVYDPNPVMIAQARKLVGDDFRAYPTFSDMATDPAIDAIVITSPDEFHPEQLLAAVEAGKPTLCDKPLAVDQAGLKIVQEAFARAVFNNTAVVSCHPRREHRSQVYGWVKANWRELTNLYGPLQHIELDFSYHAPVAPWKAARSLLLDHFVHEIDYLLWLAGEQPLQAWRLVDSFDRYTVAGKLKNDITFLFNGTRRLENSVYPETIQLRFNDLTCHLNTKTGAVTHRSHEDEAIATEILMPTDYDARSKLIMQQFAAAVRGGANKALMSHLLTINQAAIRLATHGGYDSIGMS